MPRLSVPLALIALFLGTFVIAEEPDFRLKADFRKAGDTLDVSMEKNTAILTLTSSSGIGGVKIAVASGKWPERVVVGFRYDAEKGFSRIENLKISTPMFVAQGPLSFLDADKSGISKLPFHFLGAREPEPPAGVLHLKTIQNRGVLRIELPNQGLAKQDMLSLEWIDAYRN